MSAGPNPSTEQVEQIRRQINRLAEEIARLSETELAPSEYYNEFLQRVVAALAAPAGAVWLRTAQGNLQLQFQINIRQVGLDQSDTSRQMHDELLRQAAMKGQPGMLWPHSSMGETQKGQVPAGNPTDYVILLAPILVENQVAGLIEIWQDPSRGTDAQRGFLQWLVSMAEKASSFSRNHHLRQMVGQQQVWTQLEAFTRQIHGSLNPMEVAYLVANEGRRLAEADRVTVGVRQGPKAAVLAVSGADVVEKRSNLIRLMRNLFDRVLAWGEKLVYSGTKDESLPPGVLKALDAYLAESNSKLLVVMPLRDERETNKKRPARSVLLLECFDPAVGPEQMMARLEVVGKHATSALYNASEYRRIPMRFLWLPLAKLQDGLGGKARAILTIVAAALVLVIAAMILVPYPLKMEAAGQLWPEKRAFVYAPVPGTIKEIKGSLVSGSPVVKDQELIRMFDIELADKITDLRTKIEKAENTIRNFRGHIKEGEKSNLPHEVREAEILKDAYTRQLEDVQRRTNANLSKPGEFWLRAPMTGIILTGDFRENLINRHVKPNEGLIQIGKANMKDPKPFEWEIELKIPQKHIGQVQGAYESLNVKELDVDLLVTSKPTQTFKAKLAQNKIAKEARAKPNKEGASDPGAETEPVVLAWARISGDDIPEAYRLPPELLQTAGVEVRSRVRCGSYPMGYSLFYGVWEFIYEKVIFWF